MNDLRRWPGIVLAAGVAGGIIASMTLATAVGAVATVALAVAVFLRRRLPAILCTGILAGLLTGWMQRPATLTESGIPAEGRFTATVEHASAGSCQQRIIATVDAPRPFRAELRTTACDYTLLPGERITFHAHFESVTAADDLFGGGIDAYAMYLLSERIAATARMDALRPTGLENGLIHKSGRLGRRLADDIYNVGFRPATAALLCGAFFGGDYAEPATRAAFRSAGLAHLLCISGFHVALLVSAIGLLLYPLRAGRRLNYLRLALIIAAVWVYAFIAGLQPSAVRAATMLTVMTAALVGDRSHSTPNAFGLTLAFILIISPYWLFSIGFQLSAAAVAGLMCFFGKLNPFSPRRHVLYNIGGLCVAPLAATLGVFPLLLLYFHSVPLAGFIGGIAGAVIFPVFMAMGATTSLLSAIGAAPQVFVHATDAVAGATESMCRALGALPWNQSATLYPSAATAFFTLVAVALLGVVIHRKTLRWRLVAASAAILAAVAAVSFAYIPENM